MVFSAHIRPLDNEIQSVEKHCTNVAKKAEEYVAHLKITNIAWIIGILHDVGKMHKDFNDYICGNNTMKRGEIDHCYAGARYIQEIAMELPDEKLVETGRFIARVILSHHGLHDWIDEDGNDYYAIRVAKDIYYKEIVTNIPRLVSKNELIQRLRKAKEEFAEIKRIISIISKDTEKSKMYVQRAFYMGLFEKYMVSVLVDADRTDTAEFMENRTIERKFERNFWEYAVKRVEKLSEGFQKKPDRISKLRCDISNRCYEFSKNEVGVCKLVVPTGGGKTISSIRFAINYCKEHGKERIFYVAPFCSILEQNSDVIKEILGEENVLEHHSDVLGGIDDKGELENYELRTEKWNLPCVTTTLVQFLNSLYLGKMDSVRRMHQLANSVIIIDEVQSVPAKCVSLFNFALNFLSKVCKSTIVLCSATQPTFERVNYGLLFDENDSMTGDYTQDFENFKRNSVNNEVRVQGYTYREAADFCLEKSSEEGSVLFIVNTKKAALSIYENVLADVPDNVEAIHLSTNMCPEHRRDIISDIKKKLKENRRIICITTQLIEAGVDISFPCVIRSLAGIDNIAQAAGRCNRNGEMDRCCKVYTLNLHEEKLDKLEDIRISQVAACAVLEKYKDHNLLDSDVIECYFEKYFQERERSLDYQMEDMDIQTNLVNLLSTNIERWAINHDKEKIISYGQAFKTAGKEFKVIDNHAMGVIVPYNVEAEKLIGELYGHPDYEQFQTIMRKLQKYTVNIYEFMKKQLMEKAALNMLMVDRGTKLESCIYVLKSEYYRKDVGISLEAEEMEFLLY